MRGRLFWSFANFGSSYGLRFLSNIILTRLLAPEVFGVMVVVNAMRLGVELFTDVGIEQNIVRHKQGLEPSFFNTAWTMQIIRGVILSIIFLAVAPSLASFYNIETGIFLAIAVAPLLNGLHSTSIFALVKNLEVKRRTLFELKAETVGFFSTIALAFIWPTPWALVMGVLITITFRSALSYSLPHPKHQLLIVWRYAREIVHFGRWIMVSSIVIFAASNLDKLVLGKAAPLALLGIYGLARTMADIPPAIARKLVYQIVFPTIAAASNRGDAHVLARLRSLRMKLLIPAAVIFAVGVATADWAVGLLYDVRYAEAGWMLSLLLFGSWLSLLSNLNEGVLMGSGKPYFETMGNVARLCIMIVGLWIGYQIAGLAGAIGVLFLAELTRYMMSAYGQMRTKQMFMDQDAIVTLLLLALSGAMMGLRNMAGFGFPLENLHLPIGG